MPFSRPTYAQLDSQVTQDILNANPSSAGLLRYSVLGILGKIIAKLEHSLYGFLDWISKQSIPTTSTDEYLEAWGALRGVTREPASSASGTIIFNGQAGALLPSGTTVRRVTDQHAFLTTADAYAGVNGVISVQVLDSSTGASGNTPAQSGFSLGGSVAGVFPNGTAATPLVGGADAESDASLRTRTLRAYSSPVQGGALGDYVTWAGNVQGVTRVWVNPTGYGAGTVVIYTMFDVAEAANGGFPVGTNGVSSLETRDAPATGDQLAVANYIAPLRPATALVYSVSPIAYPVNVTVSGLSSASSTVRDGITAALQGMFLASSSPLNGQIFPSEFDAAIQGVAGVGSFSLIAPSSVVSAPVGYLPVLGTVTYQ